MTRTLTNNAALSVARESSLGVASTSWLLLEPNTIPQIGAKLTKMVRNPVSKNRQRRKGAVVGLESMVDVESDLTMEHVMEFGEGFMFATATSVDAFIPTAVTATGYTVASGGALAANTLIYARGFTNAANNGLKVVGAASTGTEIKTSGLVAEAAIPAAQNVSVEVCGIQGASGDITMTSGGDLASTVLNFTTLELTVGQYIWVGGATGGALSFATAADRGLARITAIAANLLSLDRTTNTFAVDAGTSKTIQIFWGPFIRNVSVDHASFLTRSYTFEAWYEDVLYSGPGDEYEYARGNYCDELTFELPLENKATMKMGFVGQDTDPPTTTRLTGASAARAPVRTAAFNTTADIARLVVAKTDETGIGTDFKACKLTIKNNVGGEKVLGTLGSKYMTFGNFDVDLDATVLFDDSRLPLAMQENTTVGMWFGLRNDDGGMVCDIPSMTIDGGGKDFPENEAVTIALNGKAHQDATLGYSLGISLFPYMPAA